MKSTEHFIPEQLDVLHQLAHDFDIREATMNDISENQKNTYADSAYRALRNGLQFLALAEYVESGDYDREVRQHTEARLLERNSEIYKNRERNVLDMLFGVMTNVNTVYPSAFVSLEKNDSVFAVTVTSDKYSGNELIVVKYFRNICVINVQYVSKTGDLLDYSDDLTDISAGDTVTSMSLGIKELKEFLGV